MQLRVQKNDITRAFLPNAQHVYTDGPKRMVGSVDCIAQTVRVILMSNPVCSKACRLKVPSQLCDMFSMSTGHSLFFSGS
mmetsp:Transcript_123119/g.245102  ORF Transcript_123119/g.245102 Transcript_123119/m.245102 type:complete len:80 (-) Transcript_123119:3-242(-)